MLLAGWRKRWFQLCCGGIGDPCYMYVYCARHIFVQYNIINFQQWWCCPQCYIMSINWHTCAYSHTCMCTHTTYMISHKHTGSSTKTSEKASPKSDSFEEYKVQEYFEYNPDSYYDLENTLVKYRLEQPIPGIKYWVFVSSFKLLYGVYSNQHTIVFGCTYGAVIIVIGYFIYSTLHVFCWCGILWRVNWLFRL